MKLLIVSTSVVPIGENRYGGVELMAATLAGALKRAGHSVDIAAPIGSEPPQGVKLLPTVKLPQEQDRDDIAMRRLWFEQAGPYDAIHDFSHGHALGVDEAYASEKLPACFMVWDPVVTRYNKSRFNICCVSEWQAERFRHMYSQEAKVFPSWGYVDGRKYHPVNEPLRERFLFLGKLTPNKGAMEAISLAKACGAKLDVVGGLLATDDMRYLEDLRKHESDDISIRFNVTEDEKIRLIQDAVAILYPLQFDEAHNLVAIEAAQCHTPMISYSRGALPSLGITRCVGSVPEFLEAMKTVNQWFQPSPVDWSVDSRIPKYEAFYREIAEGMRWA